MNGSVIPAETREMIIAMYREGHRYADIGRAVGWPKNTIGQVCKRWRDENGHPPAPQRYWTDERLTELFEMVDAGKDIHDIADHFGKTIGAIEGQIYTHRTRSMPVPSRRSHCLNDAEPMTGTRGKSDPETHFAMRMGARRHSDFALRPSSVPPTHLPAWQPGMAMGASSLVGGGSLSGAGARSARGV